MTPTFDFSGKRALVTGASSGIGHAVAAQLARSGAQVTAVGRNAAALKALQAESGCLPLALDVADVLALERALAPLPAFDLVVNCAGTTRIERAIDLQAGSFDAVMAVNARAAALVAARCGRAMIAAGVRGPSLRRRRSTGSASRSTPRCTRRCVMRCIGWDDACAVQGDAPADAVPCSANVPRASPSSLISLRKAPHRRERGQCGR